MKIFIAGARSITELDEYVKSKMLSISQKDHDVLIGDCYGVDASVQRFYANLGYGKVTVYASNGHVRNNIGHWHTKSIAVSDSVRGFEFYRQKDIAMANEAEYGFMIWDGESRGTLNNILTMAAQNKTVLVYLAKQSKAIVIKNAEDAEKLICFCRDKAHDLDLDVHKKGKQNNTQQITMML